MDWSYTGISSSEHPFLADMSLTCRPSKYSHPSAVVDISAVEPRFERVTKKKKQRPSSCRRTGFVVTS